jgi:hypothetical protein
MGQSAIGVMYGCRMPEGLDLYGEESDGPDLILEFQEVIGWKYDSDFRPVSVEGVDDVPVIGVLVAVSGSGENGAADLWPTRRLADIALIPETLKARETWERFVVWCRERHLVMPSNAELWIVTTETA